MTIDQRQNTSESIRKLQAQRQSYSDVKFWMLFILVVGVIFPVIMSFLTFFLNNDFLSKKYEFDKLDLGYLSAATGVFLAIYIEIHSNILKGMKEQAAKIQEEFDTDVFDLPWEYINIGAKIDRGVIFKKSKKFSRKNPSYNGFNDWYTKKAASFKYPDAIAFCQQQNLLWDSSLRNDIVFFSKIILFVISAIMIVLGVLNDFTVRSFLTNVVLLLLPICLYFYKVIVEHNETIKEMGRLRDINEDLINKVLAGRDDCNILPHCRQLQTAIYNHRKSARPIPNWLHKRRRDDQEEESDDRMKQYLDANS